MISARDRRRRGRALGLWRVFNPIARPLAGYLPWWVLLETTGRSSGQVRRVPLARGPSDGKGTWLIAVHGEHSDFVRNIEAHPAVRIRIGGRWREGSAWVTDFDAELAERFSLYARMGPRAFGIDPRMVRVTYGDGDAATR